MKGPLRRIRLPRRAPGPAPEETQAAEAAAAAPAPPEPLPAGLAPEDVAPSSASFRDRGRLRRRLRYLRRVKELGYRDLGGLVFDLHRFGRRNDEVVLGKLAALDAVDRELRAIERVLGEQRDVVLLREPGIAACPRCGALHGTDARFCPACGTQFRGPLAIDLGGGPAPAQTAAGPPTSTMPAEPGGSPVAGLGGEPAPAPPAPPATEPEGAGPDQPTVALPPAAGGEQVAHRDGPQP